MREAMFQMKDFGYDNFDKNIVIANKFKQQGKLDDMIQIAAAAERDYYGGGAAQPSSAAASQAQPSGGFSMPAAGTAGRPREDSMK